MENGERSLHYMPVFRWLFAAPELPDSALLVSDLASEMGSGEVAMPRKFIVNRLSRPIGVQD